MKAKESKRVIDWSHWADVSVVGPGKSRNSRVCRFNVCGCVQELYIDNRYASKPKCKRCDEKRLVDEARKLGLVYLNTPRKKPYNKRRYKFINCGHEQEIDYGSIRKGFIPTCFECLQLQRGDDANTVGLQLIGKGRNRNYGLFQFKNCEHKKEFTYASIKKLIRAEGDSAFCDDCRLDRLKSEAALCNLKLIGEGLKPKHFSYEFLTCGHRQEILPQHIKEQKNFKCKQYFDERLKEEAAASGLELIGVDFVIGSTTYRKYKILRCGHIQTMQHGLAK